MTTFSGLFGGGSGSGLLTTPHRGYKSGKYYVVTPALEATTSSTDSLVAGTIYYIPFYVHSDISISALTFANSSAAQTGHTLNTGVYNNDLGEPSSLVIAGATATLTATAAAREVTVSASLSRGWYWFAIQSNSATTLQSIAGGLNNYGWSYNSLPAAPTTLATSNIRNSVTSAYGALPSTAVAPTASFPTLPVVGIKVA